MVAETQVPGASVLIVARRPDVNRNHLFRWQRQLLPKTAVAPGSSLTRLRLSARLHRGGTDGLHDSPLEGSGFELLVPRQESPRFPKHPCTIAAKFQSVLHKKLMSLQSFGYFAPTHLPAAPSADDGGSS
jgi:hypothetical protein